MPKMQGIDWQPALSAFSGCWETVFHGPHQAPEKILWSDATSELVEEIRIYTWHRTDPKPGFRLDNVRVEDRTRLMYLEYFRDDDEAYEFTTKAECVRTVKVQQTTPLGPKKLWILLDFELWTTKAKFKHRCVYFRSKNNSFLKDLDGEDKGVDDKKDDKNHPPGPSFGGNTSGAPDAPAVGGNSATEGDKSGESETPVQPPVQPTDDALLLAMVVEGGDVGSVSPARTASINAAATLIGPIQSAETPAQAKLRTEYMMDDARMTKKEAQELIATLQAVGEYSESRLMQFFQAIAAGTDAPPEDDNNVGGVRVGPNRVTRGMAKSRMENYSKVRSEIDSRTSRLGEKRKGIHAAEQADVSAKKKKTGSKKDSTVVDLEDGKKDDGGKKDDSDVNSDCPAYNEQPDCKFNIPDLPSSLAENPAMIESQRKAQEVVDQFYANERARRLAEKSTSAASGENRDGGVGEEKTGGEDTPTPTPVPGTPTRELKAELSAPSTVDARDIQLNGGAEWAKEEQEDNP